MYSLQTTRAHGRASQRHDQRRRYGGSAPSVPPGLNAGHPASRMVILPQRGRVRIDGFAATTLLLTKNTTRRLWHRRFASGVRADRAKCPSHHAASYARSRHALLQPAGPPRGARSVRVACWPRSSSGFYRLAAHDLSLLGEMASPDASLTNVKPLDCALR